MEFPGQPLGLLLLLSSPVTASYAGEHDGAHLLSAEGQDELETLDAIRRSRVGSDQVSGAVERLAQIDLDVLFPLVRTLDEVNPDAEPLLAGWSAGEAADTQGTSRPYQLYVPETVANGAPMAALVVHIHGAVGRPDFGKGVGTLDACGYAPLLWRELADEHNFVIAVPLGRADCAWWTKPGGRHVRAVIRDVKRRALVPSDAVFCAGFSDGGSGAFHLAMTHPEPFAGFIALNGHPAVASAASGDQVYLENLIQSPMFVGVTHEDSLYPSRAVLPHLTTAIAAGAPMTVLAAAGINHQPSYFENQHAAILQFLGTTRRPAESPRVRWFTSAAQATRVDWLEILELGATPQDAPAPESSQHMTTPGRIRLGVQLGSEGTRIKSVTEGSLADTLGLIPGDTLNSIAGIATPSSRDLRSALRSLVHGQAITAVIERGGATSTLSAEVPPFVPEPIYAREQPTAFVDARWWTGTDGAKTLEVTSKGVAALRIHLPDGYDLDEVPIRWNGESLSPQVRSINSAALLAHLATHGDSARLRRRYVELR